VREIRMLRAMWRALETGPRQVLNGHEGGNPGYKPRMSLRANRASARPYHPCLPHLGAERADRLYRAKSFWLVEQVAECDRKGSEKAWLFDARRPYLRSRDARDEIFAF
jgi:hypothetical protein